MSSENRESGNKRNLARPITIGLAAIAVAIGAYLLWATPSWESTDDALIKGNQVVVSAQVMAQITGLAAEEHESVAKGQTLVKLDDLLLLAQEQQAQANEEYAERNDELAQVKLDQARSDFNRANTQLRGGIISQEQFDHASSAFNSAQSQSGVARAQIRMAEAQLAAAGVNLSRATIASPIDGVVAKKWATLGSVAQPAQPIYALYDLKDLWVEANFKETQIRRIGPGDYAEVTVDAFGNRPFTGKVESIGSATAAEFSLIPPDNASGNFTKVTQRIPVKIALDKPETWELGKGKSLVPGMSVEVRVKTSGR
jgi:membrane fusion protein (multidrug efflux system)